MKRKIALLLAFTMVVSMLPVTALGNWWGTGNRTGTMWEQTAPTNNLRHWGDGVLVTRDTPGRAAQFIETAGARPHIDGRNVDRRLAPAPGGVHRHIGVALDYFRGRENVSSTAIRVDINNAHTWAVGHGSGTTGLRGYMNFTSGAPLADDLGHVLIDRGVWNPGWTWGNAPVGTNQYRALAERLAGNILVQGSGHNIQSGQWEAYVNRLTTAFANRAAHTEIVEARDAQGVSYGYFVATLIPMGRRWAELILVNATDNPANPGFGFIPANDSTFIPVPIEYVTQGSTNDNPVFLTFTQQTGWPEAGHNNRRTDLTVVAQNRFNLSVDGVRHFHRYGRAAFDWVRIAEGAQGAFDHNHWYIQLDIITPGFSWARQSVNASVRSNHGASGIGIPSAWTTSTDFIVRAPRITDRSARETGNNDRYTLAVTMPGAVRDGRTVMDRLDIGNNLYIVANDRARNGDVQVELTMWRASPSTEFVGQGSWNFNVIVSEHHPLTAQGVAVGDRLQVGTIVNLTQAEMNRFTDQQRRVPAVPTPQDIAHVIQEGSINVGTAGTYWTAGAAVGARLPHYLLEWRWTPAHLNYGAWGPVGDHVFRDTFTAARFGSLGLEFFVHEDYDADDHWLRSGSMEWDIVAPAAGVVQNVRGYVVAGSPNPDYHRVVRTVLRETVPGSLPATGAHPTTFSFDEGIQILGARFWTNDADFIEGHNDISDAEVWFDASRAGDNYLGASIARNTLTIRPEIGHSGQRNTVAEIHIEFYVSVQANFEGLYGAPIEVTVESGTVESPFEETLVVAYAWDPITASTTVVTVDEGDISAAFGLVRAIPVSNVVITEVEAGVLLAGSRLWVGVEGGISRGWGAADHISLGATHVTTNDPTLQFSPIRLDSHGAYVEIIRGSRYDGATITFHGVAVSGRVIPDHQYNIVVAGDAVAANWEEFAWVMGGGAGSLTRGATHGFFAEEPYATPAFTFTGQDIALDGPGQTQVPGTGLPGTGEPGLPGVTGPVARTIHQNQPFQTARAGEAPIFPAFEMINTYGAGGNASAFLAVAVVRDILGWTDDWNEVARTATFTTPAGMAIVFTEGSATVSVNGTQMTMVNTDGTPIPARISPQTNRFVVPIRFFTDLGVTVTWLGGTPGNFSLMVSP